MKHGVRHHQFIGVLIPSLPPLKHNQIAVPADHATPPLNLGHIVRAGQDIFYLVFAALVGAAGGCAYEVVRGAIGTLRGVSNALELHGSG